MGARDSRDHCWLLLQQRLPIAAMMMVVVGCHARHERSSSRARAMSHAAPVITPSYQSPSASSSNEALPPSPPATWSGLPPESNFDALPVVEAAPCREGGARAFVAVPRERWKPILEAVARAGWPPDTYAPNECMHSLRARCAPDLDGLPGAEELVEVAYRVPRDGIIETQHPLSPSCASKDRSTQGVILALSPPATSTGQWSFRGIVGFTSNVTGEGGLELTVRSFVRLPNGSTGVRAYAAQPGFSNVYDLVKAYDSAFEGGPEWRTAGNHQVPPPPYR
jgi:hypothetical protein